MGKNRGSILLTLVVLTLAIFGKKTHPAAATPPKEADSRENYRRFWIAMLLCAAALAFIVLYALGQPVPTVMEPVVHTPPELLAPLPTQPQPRPLAWRLGAVFLIFAPIVLAIGLATSPKGDKYRAMAASEIWAPWLVALVIVGTVFLMGAELADFANNELVLIALVFPWIGAIRILMNMHAQWRRPTKTPPSTRRHRAE